jgi:hypothetical protein
MEKFVNDIYSIYELINNNNDSKSFINVKTISKQYLAYYIYRIITKFMILVEDALSGSAIDEFITLLRIPKIHNRMLNYPLSGKMTNDEQLLDMIILMGIDMFNKLDKYIKAQTNLEKYTELFVFLEQKKMPVIIQDLIDLQKLIPGLSVSAIRQNFISNSNLI